MNTQIDQFCSDLRMNLKMIDEDIRVLEAKAGTATDEAERAVRQQIDSLRKKIDGSKPAIAAATTKARQWVEGQKSAAQNKIAEWKAKGDAKNLQLRAEMADDYAAAMSVIASSAVNEAAKASLEALLAHCDVKASKVAEALR